MQSKHTRQWCMYNMYIHQITFRNEFRARTTLIKSIHVCLCTTNINLGLCHCGSGSGGGDLLYFLAALISFSSAIILLSRFFGALFLARVCVQLYWHCVPGKWLFSINEHKKLKMITSFGMTTENQQNKYK